MLPARKSLTVVSLGLVLSRTAPCLTALLWAWHMDGEYGVPAAYVGLPGLAAMTLVGMSLVAHWVVVSWDKWQPQRRERGSRRYPRIGYAHELAKHDLVEVLVAPFLLSVVRGEADTTARSRRHRG